jgi:hypothetical protein
VGGGCVFFSPPPTACTDLDVANLNNPDRFRAMADPNDVDVLIGNTYRTIIRAAHGSQTSGYPSSGVSGMSDEMGIATLNGRARDRVAIPRIRFDNEGGQEYPGHWTLRRPWDNYYVGISAAVDGLNAIRDGDLQIGTDGQDTRRAQIFGHFIIGIGHLYAALQFDKGYWYDFGMELAEDLDFENMAAAGFGWVPYDELAENARGKLLDVIDMIESGDPFDAKDQWFNDPNQTSEDLKAVAHSYIARSLVYTPRSPEERAAVDWEAVLYHAERGIQDNWGPIRDRNDLLWWSNYHERIRFGGDARIHPKLIGPADTSGAYQAWLATPHEERTPFFVATPDRRFPTAAVNGLVPREASNTNLDEPRAGVIFQYRTGNITSASFAPWQNSSYTSNLGGSLGDFRTDDVNMQFIRGIEMDFFRAEAYYRLGQPQLAADIINATRTTRGELPAVTVDGVPVSAGCVPRTETGQCGDLWDALIYEQRIEAHGIYPYASWGNSRGWGTLEPGTPLHLPIPRRELDAIQQEVYTFGGVGGPGAAP